MCFYCQDPYGGGALYGVAMKVMNDAGLPWIDPRTGKTYYPPRKRKKLIGGKRRKRGGKKK